MTNWKLTLLELASTHPSSLHEVWCRLKDNSERKYIDQYSRLHQLCREGYMTYLGFERNKDMISTTYYFKVTRRGRLYVRAHRLWEFGWSVK